MNCKDIPDIPILEFLLKMSESGMGCGCWFSGFENSVRNAMPDVPDKLAIAKMARLIRRGLVDGCGCGCRGDYVITEKGKYYILQQTIDVYR